jgi:hypothetical protein
MALKSARTFAIALLVLFPVVLPAEVAIQVYALPAGSGAARLAPSRSLVARCGTQRSDRLRSAAPIRQAAPWTRSRSGRVRRRMA